MWDPGGSDDVMLMEEEALTESPFSRHLLQVMHENLPRSKTKSAAVREAFASYGEQNVLLEKVTLDTGASSGNYIGRAVLNKFSGIVTQPCNHAARMGDGISIIRLKETVLLQISMLDEHGEPTKPIFTEFYVLETLGNEAIIGLPDLLGNYYEYFWRVLMQAHRNRMWSTERIWNDLNKLCSQFEEEVYRPVPSTRLIKKIVRQARRNLKTYKRVKSLIVADPKMETIKQGTANIDDVNSNVEEAVAAVFLVSQKHGIAFEDDRIENIVAQLEVCAENQAIQLLPYELANPWTEVPKYCEEELETPDPLAMGEDILHFMEMSVEDSRKEYYDMMPSHVSEGMKTKLPKVLDLLGKPRHVETFAPSEWTGLKVTPVVMETVGTMPKEMKPRARPIREQLYANAKKEYERLRAYFYVPSESSIASPLVIAPKATAPFIRFCGDYREINKYIKIPQQPIPIVKHELTKAAKFKVYVDLDMANSFHQIPLSDEFSNLLSVQTPWGLVRPKFLPEGVGPASGLLQMIVRDVFKGFEDWTIVIFDNFLILADDYEDAYRKLEKVLYRCQEYGIVLKMKKSWIGVDTVTFFGFEVTHGKWKLSDSRKQAIAEMPFPATTKSMQSFLGAALFFHQHIPDYSEWSACLYEMTHASFVWDPGTWKKDYKAHFEKFKQAILNAATLFFPDYTLPWVVRCDASDYAVGAVLYQEFNNDGVIEHQPIAFSSKRFSEPASKWDTYKREAYAIFHAVQSFHYYLRGKDFIVETDHRNLQWIENSQTPIVVRWRALLQSFSFLIRHIPGAENRVADWLSRPPDDRKKVVPDVKSTDVIPAGTLAPLNEIVEEVPSFDVIMQHVHGKRSFHYGASETWIRAKQMYPRACIKIEAVRQFVRECPMCQKMRDTGISGLKPQTLTLKPLTYRKAVGIDHVTVTPMDRNGNKCVILIVEHFSHFPQAYAAKSYDETSVVSALLKHFATFGMFDEIVSDPGSAFMSAVVKQFNTWVGIRHKVSLVGRHESNGCEGSGKQFLRHLQTLVSDERLIDRWSDDTVLPLINFELANRTTKETGGYTPFQLKYGTQDAEYFRLPENIEPGARSHEILVRLDQDLRNIRSISREKQEVIVQARKSKDPVHLNYELGDLVLFNARENPGDMLPSKLSPSWLGPYEVLEQSKNDVRMRHCCMHTEATQHLSRLKPFFGSLEDARRIAELDYNQFLIHKINYFTGNPHARTSMEFSVTFLNGDANETKLLPYNKDLADSQQFDDFINSMPYLFPLRFLANEAPKRIISVNKTVITSVVPGDEAYMDLRFYDGKDRAWFDSLNFLEKHKQYLVAINFTRWKNRNRKIIIAYCEIFNQEIEMTTYDVFATVVLNPDFGEDFVCVDANFANANPRIFE